MTKQHIHISVEDAQKGYERFISAWKRAEAGKDFKPEVHLSFEDFAMLSAVMTPKRLELLRVLRREGPMNVKALSVLLKRDYKNVHVDCSELEANGLIQRDESDQIIAPWDVIDAHFSLVA